MKTLTNLAVILSAALLTGVPAAALLAPSSVDADGGKAANAAKVLVVDGVTLSLELEKASCAVGKKPVVTLRAVNGADEAKEISVDVVVAGVDSEFDVELARIPMIAEPDWTRRVSIDLAAGASKRVRIETERKVSFGSTVTFHIRSTEKQPRELLAATLDVPAEIPVAKVTQKK